MVQLGNIVEQLEQHLRELQASNQQLDEKVKRNSNNSHSPPSSDLEKLQKTLKKKKGGQKRGGQPGHKGHSRTLYPVDKCERVTDHYPETCGCCGERLVGIDPNPYRHQVVEIPPIQHGKKAWLWVAATPLVTFFQVMLARSTEAAQDLLGKDFGGILNSDRYSAYNWLDVMQRQLCWAHLKREFTKISERSGVSRQIGRDLLAQQKKLFRSWHRVRDGTINRKEFQSLVSPIRERVIEILSKAADYQIGSREKTPLAKTVRTCRQLLKVEAALWLFVTVQGLEPTNNAAERAIRPAVLWRRTSFGSQSQAGSVFVARMLTVVTSLRSQNRDVLEFMTEAVRASRQGNSAPSVLPQDSSSTESIPLAA